MGTLTIRLDDKLDCELTRLAKRSGRTKSEVACEALRRQLSIQRFQVLRPKGTLVEFFRKSPLVGVELELTRDRNTVNPWNA